MHLKKRIFFYKYMHIMGNYGAKKGLRFRVWVQGTPVYIYIYTYIIGAKEETYSVIPYSQPEDLQLQLAIIKVLHDSLESGERFVREGLSLNAAKHARVTTSGSLVKPGHIFSDPMCALVKGCSVCPEVLEAQSDFECFASKMELWLQESPMCSVRDYQLSSSTLNTQIFLRLSSRSYFICLILG